MNRSIPHEFFPDMPATVIAHMSKVDPWCEKSLIRQTSTGDEINANSHIAHFTRR